MFLAFPLWRIFLLWKGFLKNLRFLSAATEASSHSVSLFASDWPLPQQGPLV